MIVDDLFAELDQTAAEYGWTRLGQPDTHTRRYGQRIGDFEVTVRAFANRPGTALVGISRQQVGEKTRRLLDDHRGGVAGKRAIVIEWLREARRALDA